MKNGSVRSLKLLAALVWYIGGAVLLLKGGSLRLEADQMRPDREWPWAAVVLGLFVGGLKARFLFRRSCEENLERIEALARPRLWQFYRPGFFLFLAVVIPAGVMLSWLAHGSYPFLIAVGLLDLSLAAALIGSSYVFWTGRNAKQG